MRIALAQLNVVVGDLDGNRSNDRARRRRGGGPQAPTSSSSPSSPSRATRPRICCSAPGSCRPRAPRWRRSQPRVPSGPALVGCPLARPDLANACAVCADGRVVGVYRKQFLPNYGVFDEHRYFAAGPRPAPAAVRRDARRADDLRGRVAAGPAGDRPRAGGRAAAREHLRLAVPCGQGGGSRGDARHPRPRQRLLRRVLQPRRRPGRAGLRRTLGRPRRRGRGDRARTRIRGGVARRRRRSDRGDRPPAPRRAAPRARPRARRLAGGRGDRRRAAPRSETESAAARSSPSRPSSSRCGSRSSSASATTSKRTGSATWWWPSRAGSTRRVTAALCAEALGAERVHMRFDAVPLLVGGNARRRSRGWPRTSAPTSARSPIEGVVAAFDEALGGLEGARRRRTCRRASAARC